jgi:hypothetical protein
MTKTYGESDAQTRARLGHYCKQKPAIATAPQDAQPAAAPSTAAMPKSASCSDITGLGGDSPAKTNCNTGNSLLAAARAVRTQNPQAAAETYKQAADAYRRAGDITLANSVLAEAQALIASAANQAAPTAPPVAAPVPSPNPDPQVASNNQAPYQDGNPGVLHWHHTDDPADCANANSVERSSAEWGYMCVRWRHTSDPDDCWLAHPDERATAAWQRLCGQILYTSPLSPRDLDAKASAACNGQPDDTLRACLRNTKVSLAIQSDQNVRAQCGALRNRDEQACCADTVYLYGPQAPWQRRCLRESLAGAPDANLPAWVQNLKPLLPDDYRHDGNLSQPPEKLVPDMCPPGAGLKPDPTAFGAWSSSTCQPLIIPGAQIGSVVPVQPGDTAGVSPDKVDHFERNARNLAEMVAIAVAERDSKLAPADRVRCTQAAAAGALALIKGGAPVVPPECAALVNATRAEFAYDYAHNVIDAGDDATQVLLGYLVGRNNSGIAVSGNLGSPLPGMTGLGPDAANRRAIDCASATEHWKSAREINTIAAYEDHLARFGQCDFAILAKARIEALKKQ